MPHGSTDRQDRTARPAGDWLQRRMLYDGPPTNGNGTNGHGSNGHAPPEYSAPSASEDVESERFAIGCLLMGYDDDRLHEGLFPPGIRRTLFDSLIAIDADGLLVSPEGDLPRQLQVAATQNTQRVVVFSKSLWAGDADDLRRELSQCFSVATLPEMLGHHVERLEQAARERRLRDALQTALARLDDPTADHDEIAATLVEVAQGNARPARTAPVSLGALRQTHRCLRPGIIDGLMREGETVNIIAPPKVGKSWLAMDLALSVATGSRWLDRYETVCGRVLHVDNELHAETLSHRIGSVAYARGIPPEDVSDQLDVLRLRGRLTDVHGLASLLRRIESGTYSIIVLDALYRMLPANISENDNAAMASVYNALDAIADRMRAGSCWCITAARGSSPIRASPTSGPGPAASLGPRTSTWSSASMTRRAATSSTRPCGLGRRSSRWSCGGSSPSGCRPTDSIPRSYDGPWRRATLDSSSGTARAWTRSRRRSPDGRQTALSASSTTATRRHRHEPRATGQTRRRPCVGRNNHEPLGDGPGQ